MNNRNIIEIFQDVKVLKVRQAKIDGSALDDISAKCLKITNADLSDLEIEGAQLGGAYIHNIGMPPIGHPMYNARIRQRPIRFENCYFGGSAITNCNLENIEISDCNLKGMKIDGILVEDLLRIYRQD